MGQGDDIAEIPMRLIANGRPIGPHDVGGVSVQQRDVITIGAGNGAQGTRNKSSSPKRELLGHFAFVAIGSIGLQQQTESAGCGHLMR